MGKIALITGATAGIGEATARVFAEEGYHVIIAGRRAQLLKALKKELESKHNVEVTPLALDIRDAKQCQAALDSLSEEFAQIDVLVNNAGLAAGFDPIDKADPNDWDRMIDTNIKGLLYISRIVARGMVERGGGHIINIGSIAGTQPYENGVVYSATKHAVHGLSQGMRMDFLKHGIKVTEILPGMVETEFSLVRFEGDKQRADKVYAGVKPLEGEDVAEAALWAASQPAHVNINEIMLTSINQATMYHIHRQPEKE